MSRARLAATVAAAVLGVSGAGRAHAAAPIGGYRWVDTWVNAPWSLDAGAFAGVVDVTVGTDGDRWVLDAAQRAVHRLAADGRPLAVWALADHGLAAADGWAPVRLALPRSGGDLFVLATRTAEAGRAASAVVRLAPDGRPVDAFELGPTYRDIGVLADGRLVLARTRPRTTPTPARGAVVRAAGGLDVVTPRGTLAAVVEPAALYWPIALDVAPSGDVAVVNWLPLPAGDDGRAPPTPRPSRARARAGVAEGPVEGVVVFDPRLAVRDVIPFAAADDVAFGDTIVVSRQADVFALPATEPVWTAPAGGLSMPYFGRLVSLAAAGGDVRGGPVVVAGLAHCWFQGLVDLAGSDGAGPPAFHGRLDRPALAGPLAPLRAAGGARLTVLQARTEPLAGRGRAPVRVGPAAVEPQSLLRLDGRGAPQAQVGVCGDDQGWFERASTAGWAVDVAQHGDWVFEGAPELVTASRIGASPPWPAWQLWLGAVEVGGDSEPSARPRLTALDADAAHVAIVDAGRGLVVVVDAAAAASGDPVAATRAWPLPRPGALPVDIALDGDRIVVAEGGRRRVATYSLDGRAVASFETDDDPQALAVLPAADAGPDRRGPRDLAVLGRSGWGLRYRDGRLVARWRLPLVDAATDLAALDDGTIAVPFLRAAPRSDDDAPDGRRIAHAGVWRFAPIDGRPPPPPAPGACLVEAAKDAAPPTVRRGDAVTVTLRVSGTCPPTDRPTDLVLAVDTSRSMSWDRALERAQLALQALLAALDPGAVRVAVVSFTDDGRVVAPLAPDLLAASAAVASLSADGDTRLAGALQAAGSVLASAEPPAGRPVVVLVTDGEIKDYPEAAARALTSTGVDLFALTLPGRSYTFHHTRALGGLVGPSHVVVDPDAAAAAALAGALVGRAWPPRLLESAVVTDTLPADMDYVAGSAAPPADYAAAERTLTWRVAALALTETLTLRYQLRPTSTGDRATNVGAGLAGRDGRGRPVAVGFPVPQVRVWDRATLFARAYLPIASRDACVRAPVGDTVIVLDASHSMDAPVAPAAQSKWAAARTAAAQFAHRIVARGGRVGLVTFAAEAAVRLRPTADAARVGAALDGVATAAGTRIDRGLAAAATIVAARGPGAAAVVLLTDGRAAAGDGAVAVADALAADGVDVVTVAFGADSDAVRLAALARPPGGAFAAADPDALEAALAQVLERIGCR